MRVCNIKSLAAACMLMGAMAAHALVAVNENSLLKEKRILVIDGPHTSHANTRSAMNIKLNQIWTETGVDPGQVTRVVNPPGNLAQLINYDLIVFNYWFNNENSSFASFHTAFRQWVELGPNERGNKGWVGYHTSGATRPEWKWFRDTVTSMRYIVHTEDAQNGTVHLNDTSAHPIDPRITQGLPTSFTGSDEWYEFGYSPFTWPDVRVIYYLDESTLNNPLPNPMDPHPMAWYREDPTNLTRFFYTPMIHAPAGVNSAQGNDFFPSMILRALEWVANYQDTTTSIYLNGRGLLNNDRVFHFTGRRLNVKTDGPYRLEIRSPQGRLLFRVNGKGNESHRPAAFQKPGMYVVRVASPERTFTQRVMVQ